MARAAGLRGEHGAQAPILLEKSVGAASLGATPVTKSSSFGRTSSLGLDESSETMPARTPRNLAAPPRNRQFHSYRSTCRRVSTGPHDRTRRWPEGDESSIG